MNNTYEDLALILNRIKYKDHGWQIYGDVKVFPILYISLEE